jgi:hypothetical protein
MKCGGGVNEIGELIREYKPCLISYLKFLIVSAGYNIDYFLN